MDTDLTTLSSRGQLVIPKEFRQKLNLKAGDYLGMLMHQDVIVLKKLEVPEEPIAKQADKALKAAKEQGFSFEELLYPGKK